MPPLFRLNRTALVLFSYLLAVSAYGADELSHFAVSPAKLNEFVARCGTIPNEDEMTLEVTKMLEVNRPHLSGKNVILDGFYFKKINPFDLQVVENLTSHRDAKTMAWRDYYRTDAKALAGGLQEVKRFCLKPTCEVRGRQRPARLSQFGVEGNACEDAICAARTFFGRERGIKILWAFLRYGVNLSPYSHVNADAEGLEEDDLTAVLVALGGIPEHLGKAIFKGFGFFRFLRGKTMYPGENVIANAEGAVFDPIGEYNFDTKVYVFIHELGHRSAKHPDGPLDENEDWLAVSRGQGPVSLYSANSSREDFAESFAKYRLDPEGLRRVSLARYEFMRQRVFANVEYDQDLCRGSVRGR